MLLKRTFLSAAIAFGLMSTAGIAADHGSHSWGYDAKNGPAQWGDLKAEYAACKSGKAQSPIDIAGTVPADLEAIKFDYRATPLKLIDNGHTIQANYGKGSSITVNGKRYDLIQVHFHQPSEEKVDGQAYPMDAHLVHKSQDGELAVVAVLMKEGKENLFLQTLWENTPKKQGKEAAIKDTWIHLANLLPKTRSYYAFAGSLTTPPCSEGVSWMVMTTPVEMSKQQIKAFGKYYSHNARPVQPLNGREIRVSR
ncbi:MAG: carbonic anhydrase family protein [Burkholderiaceae bacterium]|nr:carbonic anhydrase family protein [Burkholderiaceae bacterium]